MKPSGVYIHVPFCKRKCIYCDFFSGGANVADWDRYVDSVLHELKIRKNEIRDIAETLYIGGGTPSLMPGNCFRKLVDGVNDIVGNKNGWKEFTVEVNPDDVTDDACDIWCRSGVNRVSMGVQSFIDEELKSVGRRHDSECALMSYDILRKYFDNISIDLMFGLPAQTIATWKRSVGMAVEMRPQHLSAYSLMFEEGTAISVLRDKGRLFFPGEDECVEMWDYLSRTLATEGYSQYEISNYSLPGYESVHNSRYWLGYPYLGLGPSAHSYDGAMIRRSNPSDLKGYLKCFGNGYGSGVFYNEEKLGREEKKEEMILTRMRMKNGVDLIEFGETFGEGEKERLLDNASQYLKNGTATVENNRLRLTRDGIMVADDVILGLVM